MVVHKSLEDTTYRGRETNLDVYNTLNRIQDKLTQPEVLENPSSFAERIAEFKVDFNIIESIQQALLRTRELSVAGSERDKEAVQSFSKELLDETEHKVVIAQELISQFNVLEKDLKEDNAERIKETSEHVRERLEGILEDDRCREKLALDRVAEFIERMEESEKKQSLTEGLLEESRIAAGGVGSLGGTVERDWVEREEREEKQRKEYAEQEEKERRAAGAIEATTEIEREIKKIKKGLLQEVDKLKKKWEEYLKALKRAELEKDINKRKKLEAELQKAFAKLKEESKEKIRKLYEELYIKKIRILQEAQSKLAELIREGAGKEKREKEILAIIRKDAELYDSISVVLRNIRSTRELGVFIQKLTYSLLRDPIKRMMEKLMGHFEEEQTDSEEVLRLLTIISKFSVIKSLLKKLSNQLNSGAPRGNIEKTLKEIMKDMPLNQLGEELKDLIGTHDEIKFRKLSITLLRKLEEEIWIADVMKGALKTRDPTTIAETARLLRQIYSELIPGIGGEMAVAQRTGRFSNEQMAKMIQQKIEEFRKQSGI
jgi:hypothetical protein